MKNIWGPSRQRVNISRTLNFIRIVGTRAESARKPPFCQGSRHRHTNWGRLTA